MKNKKLIQELRNIKRSFNDRLDNLIKKINGVPVKGAGEKKAPDGPAPHGFDSHVCLVCAAPTEPGGYGGTGMCGPCATGDSSTIDE